MRYLGLDELMVIVRKVTDNEYAVRDKGLLASAVERPQTTVFGDEAYGTLYQKAAALLHSLARNHALVDGNKRTAWLACLATLRFNGLRTPAPETEEAASYVEAVARGEVDVGEIAKQLGEWFPAH